MLLGKNIFLLERAGGDVQSGPDPLCMSARRQLTLERAWHFYSRWKYLGLVFSAQGIPGHLLEQDWGKAAGKH